MLRSVAQRASRGVAASLTLRCSSGWQQARPANEESSARSRHMHLQRVGGALVAGTVLAVAGTAALLVDSPARCSPGEGQRARHPPKPQLADEASAAAGVSPSPSLGEHPTAHLPQPIFDLSPGVAVGERESESAADRPSDQGLRHRRSERALLPADVLAPVRVYARERELGDVLMRAGMLRTRCGSKASAKTTGERTCLPLAPSEYRVRGRPLSSPTPLSGCGPS
jgi:hypothetical protein